MLTRLVAGLCVVVAIPASAQIRLGRVVGVPPASPVTITLTSMPGAVEDVPYTTQTITVIGGTPPYLCTLTGTLPIGITETSECVYGGTPTAPATYTFTVRATDTIGAEDEQGYTVTISSSEDFGGYRGHFQGFAYNVLGGRGGEVCVVNSLSDSAGNGTFGTSGTRTLQDCVASRSTCVLSAQTANDCARYVAFATSGTIALADTLLIQSGFLTLACQTAPTLTGEGTGTAGVAGINVRNRQIRIAKSVSGENPHDIVIQHCRFRMGDSAETDASFGAVLSLGNPDGSAQGIYNVVLDHVSISWGCCTATSFSWVDGVYDVAILDSIISEPLHPLGGGNNALLYGHPTCSFTIARSLFAHGWSRNPQYSEGCRAVIYNSLSYNGAENDETTGFFGLMAGCCLAAAAPELVLSNNLSIAGPDTDSSTCCSIAIHLRASDVALTPRIHLIGHSGPGIDTPSSENSNWAGVLFIPNNGFADNAATQANSQCDVTCVASNMSWFGATNYQIMTNTGTVVRDNVLANVGATPLRRDDVDTRVIADVTQLDGEVYIVSHNDVGGHPTIQTRTWTWTTPANPHSVGTCGASRTNMECALELDPQVGARRLEVGQGAP